MSQAKKRIAIFWLGIFLPLVLPADAQEARFSGRWVLNLEKTQIPGLPDIVLEISQDDGVIHYRQTGKGSPNARVTSMDMPANGAEAGYTDPRGNRLKCSGAFRDGKLILLFQRKEMRSGQFVILELREELSVSDDGKTLFVAHAEKWEGVQERRWPRPMVYDRAGEEVGKAPEAAKKAGDDSPVFSKEQLIEDSRQLLDDLENIHPDPYRYSGGKVAFHRRFQDVLQSIPPQGMTKDDYFRLLVPFIAAIKDAHTTLPRSREGQTQGAMPLSFASVEKCLYVDGVPSGKERALLGAKLLSLEGVSFAEMFRRVPGLWGVENDDDCLMMLNACLGRKSLLQEVLPEWRDPSKIRVRLKLADERTEDRSFAYTDKSEYPLVRAESRLEVPSMEKTQFDYRFLTPDRKTALLKIDGLRAYREMWESEGKGRDVGKEITAVYQGILKREAPADPAAALAGLPSAVEMFRRLFTEMKEAGTDVLIIDLSRNPGGDSLMAAILTYFLYGPRKLADIIIEEESVRKYSPFYFKSFPGRSVESLNRRYAEIQSYLLTENDYDFGEERYKDLFRTGKIDLAAGLALKFADTSTFLAEIRSGVFAGYYTPKNVIVTTSHDTTSSGFTMLRYLVKSGAVNVGSASSQSGNGFGSSTWATLKNTGIRMLISMNAYVVFPEAPNERKQIKPKFELTYEKLKSYGFDPNAAILYALELFPVKVPDSYSSRKLSMGFRKAARPVRTDVARTASRIDAAQDARK